MKKVAIITDSSAYLPPNIIEDLGIHVVPLMLHWEDKTYRDSEDIQAEEFYTHLAAADTIPTTSQTTMSEFVGLFKRLLAEDYAILAILISSDMSGTVQSALQAKAEMTDAPVEVLDSRLVSMPLGFMVMAAARAAKNGADLAACKAIAEGALPKIGVYFTVDTLKYLNKGGRINTAKRLVGSALNIKPIMVLRDGKIELLESVRSRKKAVKRMLELTEQAIGDRTPVRIATFHAAAEADNEALMEKAVALFEPVEMVTTFVSPVVGAHTGPGTLSIAFMVGED